MTYCFINSIALPVRTGPSFTAIERAKYIVDKNYYAKVDIYFPYIDKQEYIWDKEFTKNEYIKYLYKNYGVYKNITYKLFNSTYDIVLRWNTIYFTDLYNILVHSEYNYIIFEDSTSHFFINVLSYSLLNYKNIICIHHTNYIDIIPDIKILKQISKKITNFIYNRENIYNILYSDSIISSFKNNNFKNCVTLPIHGIQQKFFINTLPFKDSVYFMGKLDDSHKNIRQILEVTKHITDIHFYGIGKDEHILYNYNHCIYHGTSTNIIKDLENHKIYISYSNKEGICTTTIEALAMNKFCLLLDCDCNNIFKNMSNAFFFKNKNEFKNKIKYLLTLEPRIEKNKTKFTWNKANQVFYDYIHTIKKN